MFVENTLFQSDSWQRHAILARSLPPLISFPYTDHELKLFRLIVEWHLASFHFKTIIPTDCLIRFEDLLDFYGALRKLRDTVSSTSFNRPLPQPSMPPPLTMGPPKQRQVTSSNGLLHSFELPTMGDDSISKLHAHHRPHSSTKLYPISSVHSSHSSNYLSENADLFATYSSPSSSSTSLSSQSLNLASMPSSKSNTCTSLTSTQVKLEHVCVCCQHAIVY
jgi:hypothetical protein